MEIEIKSFAPVLIPTLNRYDHFKRCVESLANCTHAKNTELIIGLDYPPADKYIDGWKKISEYVSSIDGFKKVTVIRRDYNYGAVANYMDLIQLVSRSFDRFIFTEDDNIFAPNFLDYINKGLEKYKDDPRVLAVCGYNYPIDMTGYNKQYYFSHETSAWGIGRWVGKYEDVRHVISEPGFLIKQFRELPLSFFLKNNFRMCNSISSIGYDLREDVYMSLYQYKYDKYSLFPMVSLVRNHGHDGTGVHCVSTTTSSVFSRQQIDNRATFDFTESLPIRQEDIVSKEYRKYFTNFSWLTKSKRITLLLLMRMFVKIRDAHKQKI